MFDTYLRQASVQAGATRRVVRYLLDVVLFAVAAALSCWTGHKLSIEAVRPRPTPTYPAPLPTNPPPGAPPSIPPSFDSMLAPHREGIPASRCHVDSMVHDRELHLEPDHEPETASVVHNFHRSTHQFVAAYSAASRLRDERAFGGFYAGTNLPQDVANDCEGNGLYLLAQPEVVTHLGPDQPGMRLVLVNMTDKTLWFGASDSTLEISQEAEDAHGNWRPIDHHERSWCGNSFHSVAIERRQYWVFATPRPRGPTKTNLRFRLDLEDGSKVYSNTFPGSIHRAHFRPPTGRPFRR